MDETLKNILCIKNIFLVKNVELMRKRAYACNDIPFCYKGSKIQLLRLSLLLDTQGSQWQHWHCWSWRCLLLPLCQWIFEENCASSKYCGTMWHHVYEGEQKRDCKWWQHFNFCFPVSVSESLDWVIVSNIPVLIRKWQICYLEEVSQFVEVVLSFSKIFRCTNFDDQEEHHLQAEQSCECQESVF